MEMNNNNKPRISVFARKMSDVRIGQRLVVVMMMIITITVIPIIVLFSASLSYQNTYNRILENLSDISFIIQETKGQGYRIIDYCSMNKEISGSGETEIIVEMMKCIERIRGNIGEDERYRENQDSLDIVDNLLTSYAASYKNGTQKCGERFNLSGDSEFYSMVDTANYIVNNCNNLLSLEMNRSADLRKEMAESFRKMLIAVSVFVLVVILLMISLVYSVTESITYPLGVLMSHIADISRSGLISSGTDRKTSGDEAAGKGEQDND